MHLEKTVHFTFAQCCTEGFHLLGSFSIKLSERLKGVIHDCSTRRDQNVVPLKL